MFGLIYLAFMVIATLIAGIEACNQNSKSKKRWSDLTKEDNPNKIYYDRRGTRRDLTSNLPLDFVHSYRTGDLIKVVGFDRKTKINISEQWRKEHFNIAKSKKNNQYSVFPDIYILHNYPNSIAKQEEQKWDDKWYAIGQWWKDLETEELYCIRELSFKENGNEYHFDCYINIDSGLAVRPADDHNYKKVSKDLCFKAIETYNKQKKDCSKPTNLFEWNCFYENSRISKWSGYSYLASVLREMERDGCKPSTI